MNNISTIFVGLITIGVVIMLSFLFINLQTIDNDIGTFDEYYTKWLNTPSTDRPSNPVSSYNEIWSDKTNINPILPLSILITFFSFLIYLYYFDWKYEPQLEMFGRYGGYYEL